MTPVPTRWRTLFEDQVADAEQRLTQAREHLDTGDGGRALQAAYQAVVAAATVRVWLDEPPWETAFPQAEFQRRATDRFPNQFAALATLDLQDVLTSAWTTEAAGPYVTEADAFVRETKEQLTAWLGTD